MPSWEHNFQTRLNTRPCSQEKWLIARLEHDIYRMNPEYIVDPEGEEVLETNQEASKWQRCWRDTGARLKKRIPAGAGDKLVHKVAEVGYNLKYKVSNLWVHNDINEWWINKHREEWIDLPSRIPNNLTQILCSWSMSVTSHTWSVGDGQ